MDAVIGTVVCDDAIPGALVISASRKSLSFCRHSVYSGTAAGSGCDDQALGEMQELVESRRAGQDERGRVEHNAVADARSVGVGDETMIGPIMCDGGSEIEADASIVIPFRMAPNTSNRWSRF